MKIRTIFTNAKFKDIKFYLLFWSVIVFGLAFIFSSHPMMKIRYDIWQHLGNIDTLVLHPNETIFRSNWHSTWATIFRYFHIENIYLYALIIHRIQFALCCILIYMSAKLMFEALLKDVNSEKKKSWLASMALSSLLVWVTIIGTESGFQQAWIMWYSVNYQITLPLLFFSISLFVNIIEYERVILNLIFKYSLMFFAMALIYIYHASEFAYLIVYMPLLLISFGVFLNKKNTLTIAMVLTIIVAVLVHFYADRMPELVKYISIGDFKTINTLILEYGAYNVNGGNRYHANWNELYFLSFLIAVFLFYGIQKKIFPVNIRVSRFIIFSLVFCLIPSFVLTSGIASLISYAGIVNRYYFASYIFLILPLSSYLIFSYSKKFNYPEIGFLSVLVCIFLTFMISKKINNDGVFYQNIKSLKNSLSIDKVGVDMSREEINYIGKQIEIANDRYNSGEIIFCASYQKSYIIKYLYRQNNIFFERRHPYTLSECQEYAKIKNKISIEIN